MKNLFFLCLAGVSLFATLQKAEATVVEFNFSEVVLSPLGNLTPLRVFFSATLTADFAPPGNLILGIKNNTGFLRITELYFNSSASMNLEEYSSGYSNAELDSEEFNLSGFGVFNRRLTTGKEDANPFFGIYSGEEAFYKFSIPENSGEPDFFSFSNGENPSAAVLLFRLECGDVCCAKAYGNAIPEPATFAILGIGCLFFLRKH